jgi:hypothetical protein
MADGGIKASPHHDSLSSAIVAGGTKEANIFCVQDVMSISILVADRLIISNFDGFIAV